MGYINHFEELLSGGHPNSLGNSVEVVDIILNDKKRLDELYQCYFSRDEVVRLRVSNAMKRICKVHPDWLEQYLGGLVGEVAEINQASTKWTLAQLFLMLRDKMTEPQINKATMVMKKNLETSNDWIVQNTTIETLGVWAERDESTRLWLMPLLEKYANSDRKSVAGRAKKVFAKLSAS